MLLQVRLKMRKHIYTDIISSRKHVVLCVSTRKAYFIPQPTDQILDRTFL